VHVRAKPAAAILFGVCSIIARALDRRPEFLAE
jgi:hypothetical protein